MIKSDLKYKDLFKDPFWLMDNLFNRYKIVYMMGTPLTSVTGSGSVNLRWMKLYCRTGTTPNSRALMYDETFGFNSGGYAYGFHDWSKWFMFDCIMARRNSDPEIVARIQIKPTSSEGALADVGVGVEIDNLDIYGEAYGTSRGTVSLGTLTNQVPYRLTIVHIPNSRVEFYINRSLKGTLSGDYVPSGVKWNYLVVSIINGAAEVDGQILVGNVRLIQEW